ncbi:efflux RND transporter permease subunit [Bacillus carboniphilus]|uniref:Efflux RND transporter permease subunit n=1 Tax=Bacillus carboniphilus TaxID=86663 RepID=A0ABY9JS07_9BACI|nr:efflux RND transporter permease subunit [Bacillus carboniphilus]WLR42184.1 efflux RND transporter permease subunit [Bacillus carboniphilus]
MKLLKFIVQRKILVMLSVLFIVFVGTYSTFKLDKELMPDVSFDMAFAAIQTEDLSAIELERTITTPLEKQLIDMEGVEEINSTTSNGNVMLNFTFERGKGDELTKDIEATINSFISENDRIQDFVISNGFGLEYEFFMDISGDNQEKMTAFAEDILKPRLEELPEVKEVNLSGLFENEVNVTFNQDQIQEKGLLITDIISIIQQVNTESTIGNLSEEEGSTTLRWNSKLNSIEDVESIKIPAESGFITLKDIAKISLDPIENQAFVWKNGAKDLIFIQIARSSTVTQIEMAEAIREEVKNIKGENLIDGFTLNELVAQADYVQDSLDSVTKNILIGAVIAFVIMFIFLRNLRATIIIGISIPTSILLTFLTMWLLDYSFNILTLIALGLGVGMMVDASIVILESIYRKKEQGLSNLHAVLEGTKEVSSAVLASMLTTIVVFLPIGLLGGETGQFMIMFSVVIAITLISSVLVSFTVIPSLSEKFLKVHKKQREKSKEGPIVSFYGKLVSWTVKKKRYSLSIIGLFIAILVTSLLFITKIPMAIMPDMLNRYTEVNVQLQPGATLEEKEELAEEIHEAVNGINDVETNYVMDFGQSLYVMINMTKDDDITMEQKQVNEEILKNLRGIDSDSIKGFQTPTSAGASQAIQLQIEGEKFEEIKKISSEFTKELEELEGIVEVNNSVDKTSIEQIITLKEDEIDEANLSKGQIKQFIEQSFLNIEVSTIQQEDHEIPIKVKWEEDTTTTEDLLDLSVPTAEGTKKLSNFIELTSVDTPTEIGHTNGNRYTTISADVEGRDLGSINRDVQEIIEDFETPAGYQISKSGSLEQQTELFTEMLIILGVAIFLVYFVMAVQFNHLGHPLIVMSVIPMTIVGVILGLLITQRELTILSGMGVIMLIGIVLNNAILLIDRTNQLRKQEYTVKEALVEAGKNRLRPIFMTTLTTAGGMLPLALASGTSGNYQAPTATVIISGLLFATFITLLLIPAVYRLFSFKEKRKTLPTASKELEI